MLLEPLRPFLEVRMRGGSDLGVRQELFLGYLPEEKCPLVAGFTSLEFGERVEQGMREPVAIGGIYRHSADFPGRDVDRGERGPRPIKGSSDRESRWRRKQQPRGLLGIARDSREARMVRRLRSQKGAPKGRAKLAIHDAPRV